jgi:hypothetical protein
VHKLHPVFLILARSVSVRGRPKELYHVLGPYQEVEIGLESIRVRELPKTDSLVELATPSPNGWRLCEGNDATRWQTARILAMPGPATSRDVDLFVNTGEFARPRGRTP